MAVVCVAPLDDDLQHQYVRTASLQAYGSNQFVGKFKLFTNTDESFSNLVERVHRVVPFGDQIGSLNIFKPWVPGDILYFFPEKDKPWSIHDEEKILILHLESDQGEGESRYLCYPPIPKTMSIEELTEMATLYSKA